MKLPEKNKNGLTSSATTFLSPAEILEISMKRYSYRFNKKIVTDLDMCSTSKERLDFINKCEQYNKKSLQCTSCVCFETFFYYNS
jgi:hypothetical protein